MNRAATTVCLSLIAALATPGLAHADAEDTLNVLAAESIYRDNNLFRLAPGVDAHSVGLTAGRSDSINTTQLGLRLDKTWSLQRVQLDATTTDNRYSDYSYLNYTANTYRGAWLWQLTPRLTGSLTADRQQSLINYADYRNFPSRNLRTQEDRHFDADWWLHGSWHLVGGVTDNSLRNSVTFTQEDNYRLRFAEAGTRYVSESGSSITLLGRNGNGTYPNRTPNAASLIDNEFRQKELQIRANWEVTGLSSFDGRIARVERKHTHFAERDYSATIGRINYQWSPSQKLQINVSAARDVSAYQDYLFPFYSSSYVVTDSLSVVPVWSLSAKVLLRLKYDQSRRNFKGGTQFAFMQRKDTPHSLMFGVDWLPTRTLTLSCTAQREHRGSTIPGYDYDDSSVGVNAQLLF